ncbi:HD domain-containing protein [Chelatococcus asaccharovorans]|uniref:HD domain-containing protein n=1 Tax=Chelatococcus asaccharovorans TaxID=28210 RepID=UPI00224C665B|nr:HD domain-containing protein [Chelatococcus asaccharovorans]CAH1652954.1 Deoxyguanosinetriphosphate triphosphohydrolase [Chelatococcus asaccharovorans]CAH1693835.1 Deoxyguanosinetriphosphate triphosphohydrolase [Chelatococcus asaccharovorans]
MAKQQRIRDPVHDLIEFDIDGSQIEKVLWRVIQTRPFQRLRRIKQLGFSDFVYPGATHSRLLHSLGVFHTARRLVEIIEKDRAHDARGFQAVAAALLHDLGHGPFSHAFEKIGERFNLKMANHETVSEMLIRDSEVSKELQEMGSGFANDVADMVVGSGTPTIYSAVVSSQFDADRLDYMRRDRLMAGTQHAGIDFEWLLGNLEVGEVAHSVESINLKPVQTFVLGQKAIFAAESYVLGLFQLYPTVYLHKTTRGAEKIYTELLARAIALIQDGSMSNTGLPVAHPLVNFARTPERIDCALALDDTVVWGALALMVDSCDEWISKFAKRIRDRELYKCIDVRAHIAHQMGDEESSSTQADTTCAIIRDEIINCLEEWAKKDPNAAPRILFDEVKRSPYNELTEDRKGPLNQINIRTEGGHLIDLSKRSTVVAKLNTYKAFRVYHAKEDEEAKKMIGSIIDEGITKWPA